MTFKQKMLKSNLAYSTRTDIYVRGKNLCNELMGTINLGDMAFLELTGRMPSKGESVVFNAMLISLVEHGMTPSTIAGRMTYLGSPEAMQGAVAAGLLGMGSVFVGTMEDAARLVQMNITKDTEKSKIDEIAANIVAEFRKDGNHLPGFGHPIHKPDDPRTLRLWDLAEENDLSGRYVMLMKAIGQEANKQYGKHMTINVTGAIGAIASEMGFPWKIVRGFGVMARAIGLVAHIQEEIADPMGREIWFRIEEEASQHINKD